MAGCTSSAHGFVPYFRCASKRPATDPGTPAARAPVRLRSVSWPVLSRYMSREAPPGAFSRKSRATFFPLIRATRNPPPPMFPAVG